MAKTMAKTILEKINELQSEPDFKTLNDQVQPKVQAMILSLIGTDDWNKFVHKFIDHNNSKAVKAEQLARLTLQDRAGSDPEMRESVAYLFANSMCGGTTGSRLHENIDNILDKDIDYSK